MVLTDESAKRPTSHVLQRINTSFFAAYGAYEPIDNHQKTSAKHLTSYVALSDRLRADDSYLCFPPHHSLASAHYPHRHRINCRSAPASDVAWKPASHLRPEGQTGGCLQISKNAIPGSAAGRLYPYEIAGGKFRIGVSVQ